ncbi:branched-chain amino acid ABC transporter substrate-binding protein [Parafrankia colletiae]|uniref:Branched-chain amino acid ABC transporter substrate-binding protein n=1 Tax=Parafrankia colletiae TaxID=573497 RepID=A0A1S1QMZ3_9ACTN|nr:branched-chain amino acid ABC transporter substrate-binding protein [Parafrankia colletiae]
MFGARLGAATLTLGLLLAAGCGSDSGEGSSPGGAGEATALLGPREPAAGMPVRIGLISDGKGPVSDLSIEGQVADATVGYLNEHRSGIAGHPIELVTCRSLADPAIGTDCANRMVEEDVVAVVVGSSAVVESIWEPLHQSGVPVFLSYANGAPLRDSASTFTLSDSSYTLKALVQLAKDEGVKKLSIVAVDVPTSAAILREAVPPLFEGSGIDVDIVPVPPGTADMTPQMQTVVDGDPELVQVVGNDAFCISAFNGLRAVGYDGLVTSISNCLSDRTRMAVPGDFLEGMVLPAVVPIGTDNPSTRIYNAVATAYGSDIDTGRVAGLTMFTLVAALEAAADGVSGDITSDSVVTAIKGMPETDVPGATGLRFRCNGKAVPATPALCVRGWLTTTLGSDGQPTDYKPVGVTPIED